MQSKTALRQHWRQWRRDHDPGQRIHGYEAAITRLMATPQWAQARTVALYAALPQEADLRRLIEDAHHRGVTVALPVVTRRHHPLTWRAHRPGQRLIPGNFRVPEPPETAAVVPPGQVDLVVVPALAVDKRGYRLGYGGGYYDRTLPLLTSAWRVWLGLPGQLVQHLPSESYDEPVAVVVTEDGLYPRPE